MTQAWSKAEVGGPMRANRDQEEEAAVAAALVELPLEHLARKAFAAGVETIALTHLVASQAATVEALKRAYLDGFGRLVGCYFRP